MTTADNWRLITPEDWQEYRHAIVWNGEIVGEAVAEENWCLALDDDSDEPKKVWRWAKRGSCGCCRFEMNPQPTHIQELPAPPISETRAEPRHWIVINVDTQQAWSNEFGWVDNDSYDLFTDAEKEVFNLPIGGSWRDPSPTK